MTALDIVLLVILGGLVYVIGAVIIGAIHGAIAAIRMIRKLYSHDPALPVPDHWLARLLLWRTR